MQCLSCGHIASDTDNYCPACGTQLKRPTGKVCLSCGRPVLGDAERCELCDTRSQELDLKYRQFRELSVPMPAYHRLGPKEYLQGMAAGSGRPVSERRVITTLFADVVGSTSLAEKLDPEDVTRIINSAFKGMAWPIKKYEGTLARLMGDGILAIFGAPLAHENDPVRACHAALEMLDNISELSVRIAQTFPVDGIKIRVGIATGLAVVGEVGTPERSEYTAMGDSVNLAARLQSLAEPGTIALSDTVQKQLGGQFQTTSLGPQSIRGKSEPVELYRLEGLSMERSGRYQFKSSLVGREKEIGAAREWLARLNEQQGGLLIITAPNGMGKSHFLHELKAELPPNTRWSHTQALSYSRKLIYSTIREHALGLLGASVNTPPAEIRRRLMTTLPDIEQALLTPLVYVLRGELSEQEQAVIKQTDPEMMAESIRTALLTLFTTVASRSPLALACDDAHWLDRQSQSTLAGLLRGENNYPISIILTAPPDVDLSELTSGLSDQKFLNIRLDRLPDDIVKKIISADTNGAQLGERTISNLIRQAEGSPFYLSELMSSIKPGLQTTSKSTPVSGDQLPQSIQAAVLTRLDRLPTRNKRFVQAASVINAIFDTVLLKEVLRENLSLDEIELILSELVESDFLARESLSADLDRSEYRFKSELVTSAIYSTLLRSDSRKLHRRTAQALENEAGALSLERAGNIAHHYEQAEIPEMAADYYYQSALLALNLFEFDQAETSLNAVATLLQSTSIDSTIPNTLYQAKLALADLRVLRGDMTMAVQLLREAIDLTDLPSAQATALRKLGQLYLDGHEPDQARKTLESALELMKDDFDEREAGLIYLVLASAYYHLNNHDAATELAELAMILNEKCDNLIGWAHARNNRGVIKTIRGEFTSAEKEFDQAEKVCTELDDYRGCAALFNNRGLLLERQEEYQAAVEQFTKGLEFYRRVGDRPGEARALCNLKRVSEINGDRSQAIEFSKQIDQLSRQTALIATEIEPIAWLLG